MKVTYKFADGSMSEVDVSEELGTMILDSRREEENGDRKERYHCISYDAITYEGSEYADPESPEEIIRKKDLSEKITAALSTLTETQKRRFLLYAEGKSYREIGRLEGVDYKKVIKSVEAAWKKLQKFF